MCSPRGGREFFRRIAVMPRAAVTCAVAVLDETEKHVYSPRTSGGGDMVEPSEDSAKSVNSRESLFSE